MIYIISQTESHLTQRGKRHPNLADFLSLKGYKVEYFSSNFYHADKIHFNSQQIEDANNEIKYKLSIIESFAYYRNVGLRRIISNLMFSYRVYKQLKKRSLDNSIIIVPSRPVEILYFLNKLKKTNKVEILVDIRDVWPDAFNINSKPLNYLFKKYCDFFLKDSLPSFDKFVHTCPKFLDWLNRYAPAKSSTFIPLGYDPKRFSCSVNAKTKSEPIKFVYIGLLQYQIKILPFIKVIQNDQRYNLTLYGDNGEGERYEDVKNFIDLYKISNVHFKGKIHQNKVCTVLKNYDIGLLPMDAKFAFPNKVFDYIASALPIYSMGDHDTSTFVKNNRIGWVSSFNQDDIKQTINKISNSVNDDVKIFSKELLQIKENYSREQLFKKFIKKIQI